MKSPEAHASGVLLAFRNSIAINQIRSTKAINALVHEIMPSGAIWRVFLACEIHAILDRGRKVALGNTVEIGAGAPSVDDREQIAHVYVTVAAIAWIRRLGERINNVCDAT